MANTRERLSGTGRLVHGARRHGRADDPARL